MFLVSALLSSSSANASVLILYVCMHVRIYVYVCMYVFMYILPDFNATILFNEEKSHYFPCGVLSVIRSF